MKLPYLIMLVLVVLQFIIYGMQDKTEKATERYPGFTPAGTDGDLGNYHFHPDTVKRSEQGWITFKMLKVVPGGYALQDATTNCQDAFKVLEGIRFRADGTREAKYPGDEGTPVAFAGNAAITALVAKVCSRAAEVRIIPGAFDGVRALEILFGPYRPDLQAAIWDNLDPPPYLTGADDFAGKSGVVRILLSEDFFQFGKTKHIFLTGTKPNDKSLDCRSCGQLLSAAIFAKSGKDWELEAQYPYLDRLGVNGEPPSVSWRQIGENRHAAVVKITDVNQGIMSAFIGVYELRENGWVPILQFSEEGSRSDMPIDLAISFADPDRDYSDATIRVLDRPELGVPDRKEVFRYREDRYVNVRDYYQTASPSLGQRPGLKRESREPLPAWKSKKEEKARQAILDYAEAVTGRNLPLALTYWRTPSEKVIRTIQNTEYLGIRVNGVEPQSVDGVAIAVDMQGKPKHENEKQWRGFVDMELMDTGEWKIVSMGRLKCVDGCDDKGSPLAGSGDDESAPIKAVVRNYFAAMDRHDPDTARLMCKTVPAGFDADVRGKEYAKITRLDPPIIRNDQASVWVNIAIKDKGRSPENWQGTIQLERRGAARWIIAGLADLSKK